MNPFDSDIFTMASLTAAINEAEYVPRRLGQMGLFQEEGISVTTVVVEKKGMQLGLVPAKERGAPGTPTGGDKRTGVTFSAVHLPTTANVMADEVQNLRAFGSEDQLQPIEQLVTGRLMKMATRLDLTHEYQRIGAVRGQILDADGSTVLEDLYDAFDITQVSVDMLLDTQTTKVQGKALDIHEAIEAGLGDLANDGVTVLCGSSFWRKFITHDLVHKAYERYKPEFASQDPRSSFEYGDINWERYRGGVGGTPFIPATKAYAIPRGVADLFITRFAPADYNDTVNTLGLPFYASSERMKHNKGVELEAQSNPIHLCTRPQAIIELNENS